MKAPNIENGMISISRQQALEDGFTLCGFDGVEYQTLMKIKEVAPENLCSGVIRIADKEAMNPNITSETLAELIADSISSTWCEDTGDDTDEVYNQIMAMDFTEMAKNINDKLKLRAYYSLTNLRLIP